MKRIIYSANLTLSSVLVASSLQGARFTTHLHSQILDGLYDRCMAGSVIYREEPVYPTQGKKSCRFEATNISAPAPSGIKTLKAEVTSELVSYRHELQYQFPCYSDGQTVADLTIRSGSSETTLRLTPYYDKTDLITASRHLLSSPTKEFEDFVRSNPLLSQKIQRTWYRAASYGEPSDLDIRLELVDVATERYFDNLGFNLRHGIDPPLVYESSLASPCRLSLRTVSSVIPDEAKIADKSETILTEMNFLLLVRDSLIKAGEDIFAGQSSKAASGFLGRFLQTKVLECRRQIRKLDRIVSKSPDLRTAADLTAMHELTGSAGVTARTGSAEAQEQICSKEDDGFGFRGSIGGLKRDITEISEAIILVQTGTSRQDTLTAVDTAIKEIDRRISPHITDARILLKDLEALSLFYTETLDTYKVDIGIMSDALKDVLREAER